MSSINIKSGDLVEILVGQDPKKHDGQGDKGKRGRVISVDKENHKVMVEGLNLVKKHRKPRSAQDQGGIIEKPRFIDVSNVALVCPKCKEAVKVAHVLGEDGKKYVRACKKCGAIIDVKEEKKTAKKVAKKATKKADKKSEN